MSDAAARYIPVVRLRSIRCQIERITEYGVQHEQARLPIRAAFRDGLARLERPDQRRLAPPRPRGLA